MLKKIKQFLQDIKLAIAESKTQTLYKCRIVAIEQNKDDDYIASIQIINKSQVLKMKPEEILADDDLTNCFSPVDVRALTYLGYLGINSPKYKILAQRLSESDNRFIFALKEKGNAQPIIKTADEISANKDILHALDQQDAHMVGFTSASEREMIEKEHIKKLLEEQNKSN